MPQKYLDNDDDAGRPMIHRAAGRGDVQTAARLLDADPSLVHTRNEINNQPLHEACWAKRVPMVRLLIERRADVNARGDFGETPLHYAVRDGGDEAQEIVSVLVRAGADIEAKDERLRQNPLGFALREFKDELEPAIQLLREKGSTIGLEAAVILGDLPKVKQLVRASAEPLPVDMVRPIHDLAKALQRPQIVAVLADWLKPKSSQE